MRQDVLHHYRRFRAHQLATYSVDNDWVDGKPLRRTFSGGAAAHGFHALSAYKSATSHLHFMKTLKADLAAHNKRSRAAKKAWKTRKAAA